MIETIANRYEVLSALGEGGMGKVLAVRDQVTDREVALKLVHGQGPAALQQLKHEFWTMTRLRHPHTVEVYDYGQLEDGTPYFTMEVVSGKGLDELLPMSAPQVREVLISLCRALSYIHAQGYVHGDLKPENVRLREDGHLKLMDFGLMERAGRAGGPIRGTLLYLAPEVARGGRVDLRADLYGLGAVAYHLLTGSPPFDAETALALIKAHLEAPIPELGDIQDPELAALVRRLLGKHPLARPQSAGEVLEALGQDAEEVGTTLLAPSFVGHAEDLAALGGLLEATEGAALALIGPPGVGKSRLAQEFHLNAQLAERATALVQGRSHAAPYAPIVEVLRAVLPLAKSACPAVLAGHAPVLTRLLPDLDVPVADSLEPAQEKLRLETAIVELLGAVAGARGLVLIVDDAERLDEASREVLGHLVRNARQSPISILMVGARIGGEDVPVLELAPLPAPEARGLMESMLGTRALAPEFTTPVIEVAEGNPRYLVDLLHHLVESGMLIRVEGAWQTEGGFNLAALPRDLQGILGQKLGALAPEAFAVARAIAVAGRANLELLSRLPGLPRDEVLYQALSELEQESMVEASPDGYQFHHPQLPQILLGGMTTDEAARWHEAVADALLPSLSEREQDLGLLNQITDHLLVGAHPERALEYALTAGERNLDLFANEAARRYLAEGARLMGEGGTPAFALRLYTAMGDAERRGGDFQAATQALERAVLLADQLDEPRLLAWNLGTLGKVRQALGEYELAKTALTRGNEVAEASQAKREWLRNLTTLGRILYFGGDVDGTVSLYMRALEVSREAALPVYLAESLAFLGYLFTSDPARQEEGLAFLQESLTIKHTLGDKFGLNDTTMLLGNAYLALGRYAEANECFLQCHQLNGEIGQRDEEIFSLLNLAIVAFEMGELAEALRLAEAATEGSVRTNSRYAEGMARTLTGISRLYLGQVGRGADEVEQGLSLAREMHNRYLEATIAVFRADMLLLTGQHEAAVSYAREALAMAEEAGVREVIPPLQVLLGMALLATGDREAARNELNGARRLAGDSNARGVGAKALWALALLEAQTRDFSAAQRLAHESFQDAQEIGAKLLAAQGQMLLGELQLVQERRSLASEHLRKALNLAESVGSPLTHCRVLRLLAVAEPLRADSMTKLARQEGDRVMYSMPEASRPAFEEAWLAPLVGSGLAPQDRLSVVDRLERVQADLGELMATARDQENRSRDLKRAHERLEQLIQFALKINQVHELQLVIEMAMDLILDISGAERGFLLLYDGDGVEVCQLRHMQQSEGEMEWEISRSIADEVLRTEQPICLKDALTDERFKHSLSIQALHLRTVLCVPIKIRNAVIGALYVDRQSVDEGFSERDLDVIMSLAALTATAIDNAHLHLEWHDKSRKLSMLNDLARTMSNTLVMEEVLDLVMRHSLELTGAERGFVLLWEADQLVCRAAQHRDGTAIDTAEATISQSICQKVADTGRSVCVADALSDEEFQLQASIMALNLRTVMCVPLVAKQSVLGLLYVDSQAIVRSFSHPELELLEAMASHASVAIENAHLYTDLARRAQELEHLVQLYEEANLRASTDSLTGLHNRRFFQDQLNRDFAQARRHRRHLSVLMCDIDHFKSFNDTYGHQMGDQVLVAVSSVLGQAVRLADVVARYGGEEFIVALPDTPLDGAEIVAERIRRSVSEIALTDDEQNALRQITVSVGVTSLRLEDERTAELIERADRALYMAKVRGRNQVQIIEE